MEQENSKSTPITIEILKRNDMVKCKDSITYYWKHNSYANGCISCYQVTDRKPHFNFNVISVSPINMHVEGSFLYVEDLQRALDLCKINKIIM